MTREMNWRVGKTVPINVYEGDRPVCQCHTAEDAKRIVRAMNHAAVSQQEGREVTHGLNTLGCSCCSPYCAICIAEFYF